MRILLILLAPAALVAQSSTPLSPVVVTATRVESPISAPATVAVLHGDTLRARGITTLTEALRLVPGVSLTTTSSLGSQTSLFLRGGQANFVLVLLDGVPLNEPGGAIDLSALTLDNIDRVEVVRGPASVLYGADATTGVVQLVSRREGRTPGASLALDGGSFGHRDAVFTAGVGGSRARVHASLADRTARGILPFNNDYRHQSANVTTRFTPDARADATIAVHWYDATYHYPTEFDGTVADHNASTATRRLVVSVAGQRQFGDRLTTAVSLASSEHTPHSDDGPDAPGDTLGFYGFSSYGTVTRRFADLRATWRAGASHFLTVGGEASRDHEHSSSVSLSQYGPDSGAFDAARTNRAWYVQAHGSAWTRATYQVGARLDDNSAFGTFRTARVGAAWRMTNAWQVRGAAGTAFRAPTFFENFATGYVRGNPGLSPERTNSREVAVDGRVRKASVSATVFQQRFRDLIQYTAVTPTPLAPNYVNVAAADADGVEVEASTMIRGTSVRGTYTLVHTRVVDAGVDRGDGATFVRGEPLMRRPRHAARLDLARAIVRTRGEVALGIAYTSQATDRDFSAWPTKPVTLPARTLVDVSANVRLTEARARIPVQLRIRGENLTGVDYQAVFGFRAPGRQLRAGLTVGTP